MGNVNGMSPAEAAAKAKEDSYVLAALPGSQRNDARVRLRFAFRNHHGIPVHAHRMIRPVSVRIPRKQFPDICLRVFDRFL